MVSKVFAIQVAKERRRRNTRSLKNFNMNSNLFPAFKTLYKDFMYQGLSKHQEVGSTPVTKVTKVIDNFWNLLGEIKKVDPER